MKLKYRLIKYGLSKTKSSYIAKLLPQSKVNEDEMVKRVLKKRSDIDAEELKEHWKLLYNEIYRCVESAEAIHLPIFTSSFSIGGEFADQEEYFMATKHSRNIHLTPSDSLAKCTNKLEVERVSGLRKMIKIEHVQDVLSNTTNRFLTRNGCINLLGYNLKISNVSGAGVFFVNCDTKEEIKAMYVSCNTPQFVNLMVPNLSDGNWELKIVSSIKNSKSLQVGVLSCPLKVIDRID